MAQARWGNILLSLFRGSHDGPPFTFLGVCDKSVGFRELMDVGINLKYVSLWVTLRVGFGLAHFWGRGGVADRGPGGFAPGTAALFHHPPGRRPHMTALTIWAPAR